MPLLNMSVAFFYWLKIDCFHDPIDVSCLCSSSKITAADILAHRSAVQTESWGLFTRFNENTRIVDDKAITRTFREKNESDAWDSEKERKRKWPPSFSRKKSYITWQFLLWCGCCWWRRRLACCAACLATVSSTVSNIRQTSLKRRTKCQWYLAEHWMRLAFKVFLTYCWISRALVNVICEKRRSVEIRSTLLATTITGTCVVDAVVMGWSSSSYTRSVNRSDGWWEWWWCWWWWGPCRARTISR